MSKSSFLIYLGMLLQASVEKMEAEKQEGGK